MSSLQASQGETGAFRSLVNTDYEKLACHFPNTRQHSLEQGAQGKGVDYEWARHGPCHRRQTNGGNSGLTKCKFHSARKPQCPAQEQKGPMMLCVLEMLLL